MSLSKCQVCEVPHTWVIWQNIPHKFVDMAAENGKKHLEFTFEKRGLFSLVNFWMFR